MNICLLLAGLRPWRASSTGVFTRVFVAVSLLSIEMQAVTWLGLGSLSTLVAVNAVVALAMLAVRPDVAAPAVAEPVSVRRAVPGLALAALGVLVAALAVNIPLEGADAYHLQRVDRIARMGTLAYDAAADPKLNALSSLYELVLADLREVPVLGPSLVRAHGLFSLALYVVAVGAVRELLGGRGRWAWAVLLVVPVVFNQLVLVKNDLFVGVIAFVVMAWLINRAAAAPRRDVLWASWLTGIAVAVKLTTLPLAVVLAGVLALRSDRRDVLRAVVLGGVLGAICAGFAFTLVENARLYGMIMPSEDIGPRYAGPLDRLVGIVRYAISLFDLGLLTRVWWPGRGGWGGTFGLPFVWAAAVLALLGRRDPQARTTLACAAAYFLMVAVVFPDGDVSQRLSLGPGLVLIAVAGGLVSEMPRGAWATRATVAVLVLSGAQILRSAVLYALRGAAA